MVEALCVLVFEDNHSTMIFEIDCELKIYEINSIKGVLAFLVCFLVGGPFFGTRRFLSANEKLRDRDFNRHLNT